MTNEGTIAQGIARRNTASNKIFELLVGLLAFETGTNLKLDDPDCSDGTNPDVLMTFEQQRCGIACKVPSGNSLKSLLDNIRGAVEQIEKSEAEIGFVVVNFKNYIDHDLFWPLLSNGSSDGAEPVFGSWCDTRIPQLMLQELVDQKAYALREQFGMEVLNNLFKEKKSVPHVMCYLETACSLPTPLGPAPSTLGILAGACLSGQAAPPALFTKFNNCMHDCSQRFDMQ